MSPWVLHLRPHGAFPRSLIVTSRRVMPVLEGLSDIEAALVEPTAVTFHAVRRTRQALGAIVVVQGAGPIGLLAAQHARPAGAGHLLVIEPNAQRRGAATKLGFTEVMAPGEAAQARVLELSGELGADGSVRVTELHTGTIGPGDLAAMLDELDSGKTEQAQVLLAPRR